MFKKLFIILVLIGFLSACKTGEAPSDEPTDEPSSAVDFDRSDDSNDSAFDEKALSLLREQTDAFDEVPDGLIMDTAVAMCDELDNGATMDDIAWEVIKEFGPDGGAFMAVAAQTRCPEYIPDLEAWIDGTQTSSYSNS